jgi:RNA polymerase sigma factor (sigma-70 family)
MDNDLEILVQRAREGDRAALEDLVARIQDRVFRLACRMLGSSANAEDAAQEILIKVITHLGGFRGECAFTTWVHRVASNHLLTVRRKIQASPEILAGGWEELTAPGPGDGLQASPLTPEEELLAMELRMHCVEEMVRGLDRETRMAYILGEVFDVDGREGGYIMDVTPEAFRKRLSRGRAKIRDHMSRVCGLIRPENPCTCGRLARNLSSLRPEAKADLRLASSGSESVRLLENMDELHRVAEVIRTLPTPPTPQGFRTLIQDLTDSGQFRPLMD